MNDHKTMPRKKKILLAAAAVAAILLIAAIATIVFRLLGKTELSTAAGFSVCIIMVFHWLSYLYLQKKY